MPPIFAHELMSRHPENAARHCTSATLLGLIRPVISAMSLSFSALPSWPVPGFHAPAGTWPMASSSAAVIIHPQVNSTVFRGEDRDSR
jgi:hypothetical protein